MPFKSSYERVSVQGGFHFVSQPDLENTILPLPPKYWEFVYVQIEIFKTYILDHEIWKYLQKCYYLFNLKSWSGNKTHNT